MDCAFDVISKKKSQKYPKSPDFLLCYFLVVLWYFIFHSVCDPCWVSPREEAKSETGFLLILLQMDIQWLDSISWEQAILSPLNCLWSFVKDPLDFLCVSLSALSIRLHWSICWFFQYHAVLIFWAFCNSWNQIGSIFHPYSFSVLYWLFCVFYLNFRVCPYI